MINISDRAKELFKSDNSVKELLVHFPMGEYSDWGNEKILADSMSYKESLCSRDSIKFGVCEASSISFKTVECPSIEGMVIQCLMQVYDTNGITKYRVPLGFFSVKEDKLQDNGIIREIVAYDYLYSDELDKDISGSININPYANINSIVNSLFLNSQIDKESSNPVDSSNFYIASENNAVEYSYRIRSTRINDYISYNDQLYWKPTVEDYINITADVWVCSVSPDIILEDVTSSITIKIEENKSFIEKFKDVMNEEIKLSYKAIDEDVMNQWKSIEIPSMPLFKGSTVDDYTAVDMDSIVSLNTGDVYALSGNWGIYKDEPVTQSENYTIPFSALCGAYYFDGEWKKFKQEGSIRSKKYNGNILLYFVIPETVTHNIKIANGSIANISFTKNWGTDEEWIMPASIEPDISTDINYYSIVENQKTKLLGFKARLSADSSPTTTPNTDGTNSIFVLDEVSNVTKRQILSSYYELKALFGCVSRSNGKITGKSISHNFSALYPEETLYPANDLYPSDGGEESLGTSMYQTAKFEEYLGGNIGYVIVKYNDGIEQHSICIDLGNNCENYYDMTDNWILLHGINNVDHLVRLITKGFSELLKNVIYQPAQIKFMGMPWMEAGDSVSIHTLGGDNVITAVLENNLSGIRQLTSSVTANGIKHPIPPYYEGIPFKLNTSTGQIIRNGKTHEEAAKTYDNYYVPGSGNPY